MSLIEDFVEACVRAGGVVMEGGDTEFGGFDMEDYAAALRVMNKDFTSMVQMTNGFHDAMRIAFCIGVGWARFRAEAESPLNQLLNDIDALK